MYYNIIQPFLIKSFIESSNVAIVIGDCVNAYVHVVVKMSPCSSLTTIEKTTRIDKRWSHYARCETYTK